MTENITKFLQMLSADEELTKKAEVLFQNRDFKGLADMADKAGFPIDEEDLGALCSPGGDRELDDDELDAVAGGWKECVCAIGGGGKADKDGLACACVAAGLGLGREDKDATRCACAFSGYGKCTECPIIGS